MEELSENKKKRYKVIRLVIQIILIVIIVAALIWATIKLYPIFVKIQKDEVYREKVVEQIQSYGGWSWLIIIAAQIIQTILAVIPSGPIVMISGILFHPLLASVLCIVGQTIGGICVFYLVKLLGYRFVALIMDPDKIKESRFLKNTRRCEVLMFGYLLIPALPKDIVAFVAPFTKIKIQNFILINLVARIPMTIVTVFMGSSLINGSYVIAIVLGVLSCILALLCFVFNGRIVRFLERKQLQNTQKNEKSL